MKQVFICRDLLDSGGLLKNVRILVVDDHEVVRRGVTALLHTRAEYEVSGEASDGQEAVEKAQELKPDVIVMDVSMPRLNGLEATRLVRRVSPQSQVIIVTQHESDEMVRQASSAGASAYVVKSSLARDLLTAIDKVSRKQTFFQRPSERERSPHLDPSAVLQRGAALEKALRESEQRLRFSLEAGNMGTWDWDMVTGAVRWSDNMERVLGLSPGSFPGTFEGFLAAVHPDDHQLIRDNVQRAIDGDGDYFIQYRQIRADGSVGWMEGRGQVTFDANRRPVRMMGVCTDISLRKQKELALKERETQLRMAQTAAEICTWEWRPSMGESFEWSPEAYELFGIDPGQPLTLQTWFDSVHPEDGPEVMRRIHECLTSGSLELEYRYLHPTRGTIWIHGRGRRFVIAPGDERMYGVIQEITERKQNETAALQREAELEKQIEARTAALQQLSSRLLQMQDEERRRIARELHDSAGQTLAALQMNLGTIEQRAQAVDPKLAECARESCEFLDNLSRELRTISHLLHPPLLDEAGLPSAVQWYVEGFSSRSRIPVQLELPPNLGRLSPEVETTIFRIIQEALTNIHRHSGSRTAAIRLIRHDDQIDLEIADQGKGIPSTNGDGRPARPGVGIQGMRERVRQLGGDFQIQSSARGTTVAAVLPIQSTWIEKTERALRAAASKDAAPKAR